MEKKREAVGKRGKQRGKEGKGGKKDGSRGEISHLCFKMDRTLKDKIVVKPKKLILIKIIMDFSDLYYSLMILADKNALILR